MLFVDMKLVSYSLDQTIKVWPMQNPVLSHKKHYEDNPVIIFDHEAQILSADVLKSSSLQKENVHLLASVDVTGTILIRNLFDVNKIETIIRRIKIPIDLIYPSNPEGSSLENYDGFNANQTSHPNSLYQTGGFYDPSSLLTQSSIFKKNPIKLLFTQDKFMFEAPEYNPPDLLLLQCEHPTKLYGIRVNPQAYVNIDIEKNLEGAEEGKDEAAIQE